MTGTEPWTTTARLTEPGGPRVSAARLTPADALSGPEPEPDPELAAETEAEWADEWDSEDSNAYQARVEAGLEPEAEP